jgi:hypothetical protein
MVQIHRLSKSPQLPAYFLQLGTPQRTENYLELFDPHR